jgi:cytochrome d ubiquinol oxidase subunit II
LLGSTWIILKTEGGMQNVAYALTRPLMAVVVAFMGLVSTWLPFLSSQIMRRWFEGINFLWLSPIPILALANALLLWRAVMKRAHAAPFLLALTFFMLGFLGLVIGIWPNLLPPSMSIWDAASAPESQSFILVGTLVMLPAVLTYTWWSYRIFAGKVTAESGYH